MVATSRRCHRVPPHVSAIPGAVGLGHGTGRPPLHAGHDGVPDVFPAWVSVCAQVLTFPADTTKTTVDGLAPTSTYQFKLAVVAGGDVSQLSDAASGDTLAANCGPKKDKKKCVIS